MVRLFVILSGLTISSKTFDWFRIIELNKSIVFLNLILVFCDLSKIVSELNSILL